MGIMSDFREERKADWSDIADAIHDSVTMENVIAMYFPQLPTRNHRCPCPFHNGKDYNFSFTKRGYKCFVCGASGDVITFVKEACELSTMADAMKRINADFRLGLPIDGTLSAIQSATLALRRAEAEKKKAAEEDWWNTYHALMDEWIRLDSIRRNGDPDSDEYAYAVNNIDRISYEIDCLKAEPG